MDDDKNTSGRIASCRYDSYNVPEGILHRQHNGRHCVQNMYRKLKNPLKSGTITKENICIPYCRSLGGKPRDAHAWKTFVNIIALDNQKKHVNKIHPELVPAKPSI